LAGALLLGSVAAGEAAAQSRDFGLGFIVGEPTGLSAKAWQSRTRAVDFAAAWSFDGDDAFHFHVDYLVHRFGVIKVSRGQLPIYYGIGGRLRFHDEGDEDVEFGIRFPVGLDYLFARDPIDIFFEIVPILDLVEDTDFELNASLGARYWF
jgi:hypothetical protein